MLQICVGHKSVGPLSRQKWRHKHTSFLGQPGVWESSHTDRASFVLSHVRHRDHPGWVKLLETATDLTSRGTTAAYRDTSTSHRPRKSGKLGHDITDLVTWELPVPCAPVTSRDWWTNKARASLQTWTWHHVADFSQSKHWCNRPLDWCTLCYSEWRHSDTGSGNSCQDVLCW